MEAQKIADEYRYLLRRNARNLFLIGAGGVLIIFFCYVAAIQTHSPPPEPSLIHQFEARGLLPR